MTLFKYGIHFVFFPFYTLLFHLSRAFSYGSLSWFHIPTGVIIQILHENLVPFKGKAMDMKWQD